LIFIYNVTEEDNFSRLAVYLDLTDEVMVRIEKLKSKGRSVRVFFQKGDLTVYEVVNNPGEARIKELL
jgi:hypothetical protein